MSVQKDIGELLAKNVISSDVAESIQKYYKNKPSTKPQGILTAIYAVLGAVLIGLGIILILAHNWDELSKFTKTVIAFIPLLLSQAACFYAIRKHKNSTAWIEATASFLFFAVGSSIALIAQIYNIPSSGGTFMLTWCLLTLPLAYLMRSSMIVVLYILIATYYISITSGSIIYLPLIAGILPYYYLLYKKDKESYFLAFLNWIIPSSLLFAFFYVMYDNYILTPIGYLCAFALCYQIGNISIFKQQGMLRNGYKVIGLLGAAVLMLVFSYNWLWDDTLEFFGNHNPSSAIIVIYMFMLLAAALVIQQNYSKRKLYNFTPFGLLALIFGLLYFILGLSPSSSQIIVNAVILLTAIFFMYKGSEITNLGVLSYGVLLIVALICCRFFDEHQTFLFRGIIFISTGAALLMINFFMHKNRKLNE